MAPRLLLLLLPLILLLWLNITCVAAIPKCCVTTSKNIDPAVLRKVVSVKFQSAGGVCEVDALVLHVKRRRICAHPAVKKILTKMLKGRRGKKKVKGLK